MPLTPKNWNTFQHYKDRKPPWIKLHHALLDNHAFSRLPLASQALAPRLWLLASEYEGGEITADLDEICWRLRMSLADLKSALKPLIDADFFYDSGMLAECKQDAMPEREGETQEQTQKDDDDDARARPPLISAEANKLADDLTSIAGHHLDFVPPSWYGAAYRVQEWLNQGWPKELILLSVREQSAKKRDGPPSRIEYFEKGIAAAIARQRSPLPTIAEIPRERHAVAQNKSGLAAIDRIFDRPEKRSAVGQAADEAVVLSLPAGPVQRS